MSSITEQGDLFWTLTHQENQSGFFSRKKNGVVRSFTVGSNLLQPTGTRHMFSCLQACLAASHVTLAQGVVRITSSMFHALEWLCVLISLRHSILHSSQSLSSSTSSSWSFLHLLCGSVRSKTLCALPRMRSLALWSTTPLSQVTSPTSSTTHFTETTEIFIQESSSDSRPSYLHDSHHRQSALFTIVHSGARRKIRRHFWGSQRARHVHGELVLSCTFRDGRRALWRILVTMYFANSSHLRMLRSAQRHHSFRFGWLRSYRVSDEDLLWTLVLFMTTGEREIGRDVKEKLCYILEYDRELSSTAESFDKKQTHMLSDGNIITVGAERFRCESICQPKCHQQRSKRNARIILSGTSWSVTWTSTWFFLRRCRGVKQQNHVWRDWWVHDKGNRQRWLHPWCTFKCFSVLSFWDSCWPSVFFPLLLSDCEALTTFHCAHTF